MYKAVNGRKHGKTRSIGPSHLTDVVCGSRQLRVHAGGAFNAGVAGKGFPGMCFKEMALRHDGTYAYGVL